MRDGHRMGAHALVRDAAGGVGGAQTRERRCLTIGRSRRTDPLRASLGVPNVEASDVELQSLWEVGTDALHYQVILRDRFPASVTRFSVGGTAEDLRAIAPWQTPACEPFPDERTQRLLGLHDDSPHSTECGRLAQMAQPKPEEGRESEPGPVRVPNCVRGGLTPRAAPDPYRD